MKPMQNLVAVMAIALLPTVCAAQVARVEIHPVPSLTITDQDFLNGRKDGKPVILAGQLRIPRPGVDKLPAVVLLHGSGGVGANVVDWEQELDSMGVATFVLDAFTGRGIVDTTTDQEQLGRLTMTYDAYRVLDILQKHRRIDPQRIAVMGFSRGGMAALYASVKRFQRMHGPASTTDFAAYIAFYAPCGTKFIDDDEVSPHPIRMFHGAADNYVPVAPCRDYVGRLKARGANVTLTEYPGAYHVFDGRAFKTAVVAAKAQTTRNCQLAEAKDGVVVNVKTGQPFAYADPCVELGPTIAYDEKAHSEALKAVREFVTVTLLKP